MIISVTNPTDFVDWSKAIHKMWSCSFWTLPHRRLSLKNSPPRNTPDSFCRRFTRQNHRCAAWAVFFFFTNKILCSCSIFLPKFVFGCWPYNLKALFLYLKEAGRSVRTAPGFLHTEPWILHKPSERDTVPRPHIFCERAGQRRCKTGAGTSFGANGDSLTWAGIFYLFFAP